MSEQLERKDFKFDPKWHYYSYIDKTTGAEFSLEPCFNGFDIGVYLAGRLASKKICTDMQLNKDLSVLTGIERDKRDGNVWNKALEIANRERQSLLNVVKVIKMGLVDPDELREKFESQYDIGALHSICPKGRVEYFN